MKLDPATSNGVMVRGKKNSLIYQSILKYGHENFSVIVLEICGKTSTVTKDHIFPFGDPPGSLKGPRRGR